MLRGSIRNHIKMKWGYVFTNPCINFSVHDNVIKWKHFPRYWPFVRGTHRSPVNSPHKGQWRGALMFSSICTWINGWVNNHEAGNLRRHRAHYDVTVMCFCLGTEEWIHPTYNNVCNTRGIGSLKCYVILKFDKCSKGTTDIYQDHWTTARDIW